MSVASEETCYLCGVPLVSGNCIAYHWHDGKHLRNRARMDPDSPWGALFHTLKETDNSPGVTFLIDRFLQREGVTAIAAPVRERKSLIALNIAHALVTGEKLFGHFEVTKQPECVIYLCPEASLGPFADRLKKILPGSVVFLDTAIRFLEGDENSSQDVRAFADSIFALLRGGAESVVMLHHSPKDTGDFMTLENAMRGSGDMGAFLACCWGTKLQDPADPYKSASFLSNLKQRDFESQDFEVTCGPDCRMRIVGDPATRIVGAAPRKNRANKDGLDAKAMELLRANPKLSTREMAQLLTESGIRRGKDWVLKTRYQLMQESGSTAA